MGQIVSFYQSPKYSDEAFRQLATIRRRASQHEELRHQQGLPSDAAWLDHLDAYEAYLHASLQATVNGLPQPTPPSAPPPDGYVVRDH